MNTKKAYIPAAIVAHDADDALPIAASLPVNTSVNQEIESEDDILVRGNLFDYNAFADVAL